MDFLKTIWLSPEGDEGGGGDAGAGEGEGGGGEGGGEPASGAVDTTKTTPVAPKFDPASKVPDGALPAELNMYEGKTWSEVFNGVKEMRKTMGDAQTRNKELEQKLKEAAASPEGAAAAARDLMVTTEEYVQILDNFYETGEVPNDFVEAVAKQGAIVAPDELLEFFQWKKTKREGMMTAGAEAAPEGVDFSDLLGWMSNGQSGFSEAERAGFQAMSARGNYSWVEMVAGDYQKAIEANDHRPNLKGNRFMGGVPRGGKPAIGGDQVGFKDRASFAAALRGVENDMTLNPGEKQSRRNALIRQRAKQAGEVVPGIGM